MKKFKKILIALTLVFAIFSLTACNVASVIPINQIKEYIPDSIKALIPLEIKQGILNLLGAGSPTPP